jgi:hypothetical protein
VLQLCLSTTSQGSPLACRGLYERLWWLEGELSSGFVLASACSTAVGAVPVVQLPHAPAATWLLAQLLHAATVVLLAHRRLGAHFYIATVSRWPGLGLLPLRVGLGSLKA